MHVQVSGQVDQRAGMLDDDAKEKGYTLLCVAEPLTDCRIKIITEVVFASGNNSLWNYSNLAIMPRLAFNCFPNPVT